jgi:hypothetical protein
MDLSESSPKQGTNGLVSHQDLADMCRSNNVTSLHSRPGSVAKPESECQLSAPSTACVPRYYVGDGFLWFILEYQKEDGRRWKLQPSCQDLHDLQTKLIAMYAVEPASTGQNERTLAFISGFVTYVIDSISNHCRVKIDKYIQVLLKLGPHIVHSQRLRTVLRRDWTTARPSYDLLCYRTLVIPAQPRTPKVVLVPRPISQHCMVRKRRNRQPPWVLFEVRYINVCSVIPWRIL